MIACCLPKFSVATLAGALACASAFAQVAPPAARASRPVTAGSLSGSAPDADCAVLRKRYLESQACFEHYRVANGSVKPEAYKACRNVVDPAPRCGPNLPAK